MKDYPYILIMIIYIYIYIYLVLNVQILVLINGINYDIRSSDVYKKLKNPIKKRNSKLNFDAFFVLFEIKLCTKIYIWCLAILQT